MTEPTVPENKEERTNLVQAIQTPLRFFGLVVLVVEVIFGIVARSTEGPERLYLIIGMISLIFALVLIVAFMAFFRPEALQGNRYISETIAVSELREQLARIAEEKHEMAESAKQDISELREENRALKAELRFYRSLKAQLLGLFASGEKLHLDQIHRTLNNQMTEDISKNDILAALGELAEEGKIKAAGLSSYYVKVDT